MKITDIRFGMLRVPLKTPFKTALRTVDTIEDIVVTVHTDTGHVGYGEAPATAVITGDTHGSIIEAIRKFIAPRLIGQEIANLNRITQLIQGALEKNSSAKAAVEIAIYDLFGQLYNAPLYKMLGGGDPGDHDGHHDQRRLHRQDGRGLGRRGRARLRVAEDQGRQGHRRRHRAHQGDLRGGRRIARCCGSTRIRAGRRSKRSSRCRRSRMPACGWSSSSNRSRRRTSKA